MDNVFLITIGITSFLSASGLVCLLLHRKEC
jgi:hypothetical protein